MFDSIINAYRDMILLESLDKPYNLTDVTAYQHPDDMKKLTDSGFTDVKFYSCADEPGHAFMTAMRHGAMEIHHQNMSTGEDAMGQKNVMNKVPSKFVATAFRLSIDNLNKNVPIRIVATDTHIDSYHRLASAIGRRYGYNVSRPYQREKDGLHTFMIGNNPSPLFGFPPIKTK